MWPSSAQINLLLGKGYQQSGSKIHLSSGEAVEIINEKRNDFAKSGELEIKKMLFLKIKNLKVSCYKVSPTNQHISIQKPAWTLCSYCQYLTGLSEA